MQTTYFRPSVCPCATQHQRVNCLLDQHEIQRKVSLQKAQEKTSFLKIGSQAEVCKIISTCAFHVY